MQIAMPNFFGENSQTNLAKLPSLVVYTVNGNILQNKKAYHDKRILRQDLMAEYLPRKVTLFEKP